MTPRNFIIGKFYDVAQPNRRLSPRRRRRRKCPNRSQLLRPRGPRNDRTFFSHGEFTSRYFDGGNNHGETRARARIVYPLSSAFAILFALHSLSRYELGKSVRPDRSIPSDGPARRKLERGSNSRAVYRVSESFYARAAGLGILKYGCQMSFERGIERGIERDA